MSNHTTVDEINSATRTQAHTASGRDLRGTRSNAIFIMGLEVDAIAATQDRPKIPLAKWIWRSSELTLFPPGASEGGQPHGVAGAVCVLQLPAFSDDRVDLVG